MNEPISMQTTAVSDPYAQTTPFYSVHRLPVEMLEGIFLHGPCSYLDKDDGCSNTTVPQWVNVSYVCRRWRDVALNCPTLWSYLFAISPRWTEELLTGSKRVPLKLHVNLNEEHSGLRFLDQVVTHSERIEDLRLRLSSNFRDRVIFPKLSSLAPRLRHLQISVDHGMLSAPPPPSSHTLVLIDYPIPWRSLKLCYLTTLNLRCPPYLFKQNPARFLSVLRYMQDLEHLFIHGALAKTRRFLSSTAFHTFQKFTLLRLSRLHIDAPPSMAVAFLSCINFPLKTEVRLGLVNWYESRDDTFFNNCSALWLLLTKRFAVTEDQVSSSPTFRSLTVVSDGFAKITFSTAEHDHDSSIPVDHMDNSPNIPLQVIFPFHQFETMTDGVPPLGDIFGAMPLSGVRSFYFRNPTLVSLAFWKHILGLGYSAKVNC